MNYEKVELCTCNMKNPDETTEDKSNRDKYIEEIIIKDNDDLFKCIEGKKDVPDLRGDYIFRGVGNKDWELIPSSLRVNNPLKDFIKNPKSYYPRGVLINLDVILDFLARADKSGLKVFTNNKMREHIDSKWCEINFQCDLNKDQIKAITSICGHMVNNLREEINNINKSPYFRSIDNVIRLTKDQIEEMRYIGWPHSDWFEIISLAQHYGLPTCALDWSYDYKVALYFAVISCLNDEKDEDCVLWAFNYKKFDQLEHLVEVDRQNQFPLWCYRPSYYNNLNLNSQKGLLTFWCKLDDFYLEKSGKIKSFDKIIIDNLDKFNEWCEEHLNKSYKIELKNNEKIFYKFIIPTDSKSKILKELYKDGYSEEYLFPGYKGVVESMRNEHKLNSILSNKNPNKL